MTDYAITFAPTFDRPPETMVGETVFDCEGNAIGWIVNATVERSCATCPEMANPDSYINHLYAAWEWYDEHVPRPTNPRGTCVVLEGEKLPEEVLFIGPDGVTHYLPEETCHMEVKDNLAETDGTGDVWLECDECHWQMPLEPTTPRFRHCPNCTRRVVSE